MKLLLDIQRQLLLHPAHVFVQDDQRRWNGLTLLVAAWHMARAIERTTARAQVGIMLPTSGLFPAALLGAWMLGKTVVPLNYLLSRDDLEYVCRDAGIDCVVTVKPMLDFIGGPTASMKPLLLEGVTFGGIPPIRRSKRRSDDELAVLLYTSGTSGRPKGVMLSCGNLRANIRQVVQWASFTRRDVMLGVLPQFHSFGLTVLTLLPLAIAAKAVYTAKFVPRRILELGKHHRATVFVAIPSMYHAINGQKSGGAEHLGMLRYAVSGGEPLPASVADAFFAKFGVRIAEGYGLTETSPVTNWCLPEEYRARSVGRPLPQVEEWIVDPQGNRLPAHQDGEIRMRGPNVMKGYWNLPQETAQAFDERGFFRTGDMGRFDDDGHLFITGRLKEMLIIGGENVFPREIEEAMNRHPSVKASAVIGAADESRGETALAFVEMNEGFAFDESALRAHCREHLAQFKVPRGIRCRRELPRNATGKIMRRLLSADLPSET
ncbi:MAG: AMP-binding protein [Planctomycetes bacterium]|nr:AMP-binding protein [Planctomycetota bacterium]